MSSDKRMNVGPSGFQNIPGIEYFEFEEDFVEENIRCIPMSVRFKLDKTGIKLKLAEWSKFKPDERVALALLTCATNDDVIYYRQHLSELIKVRTGGEATALPADQHPAWDDKENIPGELYNECLKLNKTIDVAQWKSLSELQRFALVKLSRPGHENRNLPRALKEFGL